MLLVCSLTAHAQLWDRFRGPNGSGVAGAATNLPVRFGPSENLVWKTPIPFGQSSPVLGGDRIFLTASQADKLLTLCIDAADGRLIWQREIARTRAPKVSPLNDPASPTPTTDGKNVFAFFPDFGLVSYTAEGIERWRYPTGGYKGFYGMSSSPILHGRLLIHDYEHEAPNESFLLALDKDSGKLVWRTPRKISKPGWGVPLVRQPRGAPVEILVQGSERVDSYSAATGELIWSVAAPSQSAHGTPVLFGEDVIVSCYGVDGASAFTWQWASSTADKNEDGVITEPEAAGTRIINSFGWIDVNEDGKLDEREWQRVIKAGQVDFGITYIRPGAGKRDLDQKAVQWKVKRNVPYVPSPVLYDGIYFMIQNGGIVTSLDAASGKILKQGRSRDALGEYFASPVAGDGKVYVANSEGKVTVLAANKGEWEVLQVNDLAEDTTATPALAGGVIYLRTRSSLYAFRAAEPAK